VVNAGGDMRLLAEDRGKSWEVAITHPRDKEHRWRSTSPRPTSARYAQGLMVSAVPFI
jgi:hypothetical protein